MRALRFQRDTLDVEQLDFAAAGALALNGKGRIERCERQRPSGRVDFALSAATADSLRIAADLFGLPENVGRSKHLSALAPLDVKVSLVAVARGRADQRFHRARRQGRRFRRVARRPAPSATPPSPARRRSPSTASVTGERPQAFLVSAVPRPSGRAHRHRCRPAQGRLTSSSPACRIPRSPARPRSRPEPIGRRLRRPGVAATGRICASPAKARW